MTPNNRGFFSIDVIFAFTLLLMVVTTFSDIYEGRNKTAQLMDANLEAKSVGEKLAAAINTVYANGSNFELCISLPQKIGKFNYSITFDDAERDVIVENQEGFGRVCVGVVCKNVVVNIDNFSKPIRVHWANDNVEVANA